MSSLFNISSNFVDLFDKFDEIANFEPDTDANGSPIDATGYEISDVEAYKNEMLTAWFDTLTGIEGEFTAKAENIGVYLKQLKVEKEAIDKEVKSLKARSAAKERQIDGLKTYLMNCMDAIHISKIDEPRAKISIRNNAESAQIPDEKAFIDWADKQRKDLLKYDPRIIKTAVMNAIKSGDDIPGATVGRTRSIMVR